MKKARLLIVEDDPDIANLLTIFFEGQGYEILSAARGSLALQKTRSAFPDLIILDIMLPDIDGYEVCRVLRSSSRTRHIPIIFLTQKDERSDRLQGLELGADDYITKPFDIEELKLRVQNAIARSERESLTDPRTRLPSGQLIEEQLRKIIRREDWALLDIRINHFEPFKEVYGFVAADDALRFTAMLMGEVVDELGTPDDFIAHPGGDNLIIITSESAAGGISRRLKSRFNQEILSLYNFMDREQGYIIANNAAGLPERMPMMTLSSGFVTASQHPFADIREITEMAAEARRIDHA